jgi:hypothetical protein
MNVYKKTALYVGLASVLGYAVISSANADPCAEVKAGTVKFMDSQSCIDECAVDGGDCPYAMGRGKETQPAPAETTQPKTEDLEDKTKSYVSE